MSHVYVRNTKSLKSCPFFLFFVSHLLFCAIGSPAGAGSNTTLQKAPAPLGSDSFAVNTSLLWRRTVKGLDSTAKAKVAPFFNYDFLVPQRQLSASVTYYGPADRLRRFVSDLMEGARPLKVGVVGGSISWGTAATRPQTGSWFPLVASWLASVSPQGGANVTARNGAVGGTPSAYMVLCLDYSVDQDVDLVFVEYMDNDGLENCLLQNRNVGSMERLVRRLLDLPSRPAVVMMQSPAITLRDLQRYFVTSEELDGANAVFYDVPTVSAKTAFWQLVYSYPHPGLPFAKLFRERHPSDSGHRVMADLAVYLVQQAVVDLVTRPPDEEERAGWGSSPPPEVTEQEPMYPGNYPPRSPSCEVGADFQHLVKAAQGFTWVNEGTPDKPKWGFVAQAPGATLHFAVDTVRPHVPANASIALVVYYLQSYSTEWGTARVECVSGCACEAVEVDAHRGGGEGGTGPLQRGSQTQNAGLMVSQAAQCILRVTVLERTSSAGHKFKVMGVVVTEQTAPDGPLGDHQLRNRNPYDESQNLADRVKAAGGSSSSSTG